MTKISTIPDDNIDMDKGCYHGVYGLLSFNTDYCSERKEYEIGLEADPHEEDMVDVIIDDQRELHWRIFLRTTTEGWITRNRLYVLIDGMLREQDKISNNGWVFYGNVRL